MSPLIPLHLGSAPHLYNGHNACMPSKPASSLGWRLTPPLGPSNAWCNGATISVHAFQRYGNTGNKQQSCGCGFVLSDRATGSWPSTVPDAPPQHRSEPRCGCLQTGLKLVSNTDARPGMDLGIVPVSPEKNMFHKPILTAQALELVDFKTYHATSKMQKYPVCHLLP